MYRNQYLAVSGGATVPSPFDTLPVLHFCDLDVFFHPDLRVSASHAEKQSVLLLGYAFDPENPHSTNQGITDELAGLVGDRLFQRLDSLTGRFVVFVGAPDPTGTRRLTKIVGDACALKQVYYGEYRGVFYATSSMRMFYDFTGKPVELSPEKRQFMSHPQYEWNEQSWYCEEEFDDSLRKLLPNHFYDRRTGRAVRTPMPVLEYPSTPDAIYDLCADVLQGSFQALTERYRPIQVITAGVDSRTLLAASRGFASSIDYYIFDFGTADVKADIEVASHMARDHNLNFQVVPADLDLTDEFKTAYAREHVFPSFANFKLPGIQHHYLHHRSPDLINVNGNCGEILRCALGHSKQPVPRRYVYYYTRYSTRFPFLAEAVEQWYDNAIGVSRESGVSITDLFYWELKMGTWGARYPFEQDIAIEEYSPFNNRQLLLTFMKLPAELRNRPAVRASHTWIEHMWPGLMDYAVNPLPSPGRDILLKRIYSNSTLVYYLFRYRHLVGQL